MRSNGHKSWHYTSMCDAFLMPEDELIVGVDVLSDPLAAGQYGTIIPIYS